MSRNDWLATKARYPNLHLQRKLAMSRGVPATGASHPPKTAISAKCVDAHGITATACLALGESQQVHLAAWIWYRRGIARSQATGYQLTGRTVLELTAPIHTIVATVENIVAGATSGKSRRHDGVRGGSAVASRILIRGLVQRPSRSETRYGHPVPPH